MGNDATRENVLWRMTWVPEAASSDDEDEEGPENYFDTAKDSAGGIAEDFILFHGGEEKLQILHPTQSSQIVHNGGNIDGFP